jgi:hypothetical protein
MTAFIGPVSSHLMRDEAGELRLKYHYRTAEEFVLAAAELMTCNGRTVTVERETKLDIESITAFSAGARWFNHPMFVSAYRRTDRPGARWRFGQASSWGFHTGRSSRAATSYRAARIFVEVYGR